MSLLTIESLQAEASAPNVKQQLAAIRMLFDWLVVGQVMPANRASAVRGPKHVVKTGKTPVLEGDEWRRLLDSIPTDTVRDLRDRGLMSATLTYSFARIGAALAMKVEDLRPRGGPGSCGSTRKAARPTSCPAIIRWPRCCTPISRRAESARTGRASCSVPRPAMTGCG
jgi:integrase